MEERKVLVGTGVGGTANQVITSGTDTLSSVQAVITLSYAPIADTVVNLSFAPATAPPPAGPGVVAISATATIPAGQTTSAPIPISFPDTGTFGTTAYTLNATIGSALQNIPVSSPPTLSVTVTKLNE